MSFADRTHGIVILATLLSTCYCNHSKLDSSRVAGPSVGLMFNYFSKRFCCLVLIIVSIQMKTICLWQNIESKIE